MATQQEIETQIAAIERQLNSGITREEVPGLGSTQRDLAVLTSRLGELRAELSALTAERPMTRRVLTYSTRGY